MVLVMLGFGVGIAGAWNVSVTANPSLTRTWTWNIQKTATPTSLNLAPGQTASVQYQVAVNTTGFTDSNWGVSGNLSADPEPTLTATEAYTLIDPPGFSQNWASQAVCAGLLPFPLTSTLVCPYSYSLPDATARTVYGTVYTGGAGLTGSASFDFSNPAITKVDDCVNVTDNFNSMGASPLGTVCAGDPLPHVFTYTRTIGPYDSSQCGDIDVPNLAEFHTNTTNTAGSSPADVLVHLTCQAPCPGALCALYGKPQIMVMTYRGDLDNTNTQAAGKTVLISGGNPNNATNVHIVVTDSATAGSGHVFADVSGLNPGDNFAIDATLGGQTKLGVQTYIYVYSSGGALLEEMTIHTSCSQPLNLGDTFLGFELAGYKGDSGFGSGTPPPGQTFQSSGCPLCQTFGHPKKMVMTYRGDLDNTNTQAAGKTVLLAGGNPNNATNVHIVVTDSATAGAGHVFFNGTGLNPGDNFTVDATLGGLTKLGVQTYFYIYSSGGTLLEKMTIHTSCSQPLALGDTFYGLTLAGYVGDTGLAGGVPAAPGPTGVKVISSALSGKNLTLSIRNYDSTSVQVGQINITWPVPTNGKLMNIKLAGKALSNTANNSGALTLSSFTGTVPDRTINGSTTKDLVFAFEKNISILPANYSITVTFTNSSFVTGP
jgi:hypothetical protein